MARNDTDKKWDMVQPELDDTPASGQTDATRPSTDVSVRDLIYGADRDITTDQINRRLRTLERGDKPGVQQSNLYAAPPAPTIFSFSMSETGIYRFTWRCVDNDDVDCYHIYRSKQFSNPAIAELAASYTQPPATSRAYLIYEDGTDGASERCYWISTVNRAGIESPRVQARPGAFGTPGLVSTTDPAKKTTSYIIIDNVNGIRTYYNGLLRCHIALNGNIKFYSSINSMQIISEFTEGAFVAYHSGSAIFTTDQGVDLEPITRIMSCGIDDLDVNGYLYLQTGAIVRRKDDDVYGAILIDASDNWVGNAIAVAHGGTGATDAPGARSGLGLGSMATQNTGANGSFTTVDSKTVTVANGIITAIV